MSAASTAVQVSRDLAAIVGSDHVCDESSLLTPFAIDAVRPSVSVMPATPEEVGAVLRLANQQKLTVVPSGGFTLQSLGATPQPIDILLRTGRMETLLHFDPGDLTIGLSAGMRVAEAQRTVAAHNLLLPIDPPRAAQATIGGALATAASGPLKHGYGGIREYCIGVTFVTGDGRLAKAGGRVVKNVAGYDLMKLLIGSHGTLGVIVAANFKLFAAPRQTRTFIANFATVDEALSLLRAVRRSPLSPMCLDIVSPHAHAYIGSATGSQWTIAVRAAGSDAVLRRYSGEIGTAASCYAGAEESAFWNGIQGFAETVRARHHNALAMWVHLSFSEVARFLAAAQQIAADHNFLFTCVGRAALASLELALVPISVDPPAVTQYANAVSAIRAALPVNTAAIVHLCPREVKEHINVWGLSANDLESMRAIKRALDPNDILNRGRFLF